MFKKIIFLLLVCLSFIPTALAHDFSTMNPTVKVTSYKKLFTDQVVAYGSGSGTVITADGIIITNHHVIFDDEEFKPLDAFEVCMTFADLEEPACDYTAHLIAKDKDLDIALLKLDSKDVFGNALPSLKNLDWNKATSPKEKDSVMIVGYPASGGETITTTKGQISGSETYNGYHYFKTDTDFDHGSSGGTAYDASGNFIGIPTYIRSYAENVGYFLDLNEARPWLGANIAKTPTDNVDANRLLTWELARLSRANDGLSFAQDKYPFLSVTLPKGWKFEEIADDGFYVSQKNLSNPVTLGVTTSFYQYSIDEGYMNKLNEELEKIKKTYPDYKKEEVKFAGTDAWKVTFTSYSNRNISYYIPRGFAMIGVATSFDLNELEKQEKTVQPVLDSLVFSQKAISDPKLDSTLRFTDPPFGITAASNWRIQKNPGKSPQDMLAEAVQKENFEGSFSIYYSSIPKDERNLSAKDRLKDKTKNMGQNKLLYKNDAVVLSGLEGFLYTYEYESDEYQKMKKHFILRVRNGDYEFTIEYDDLTDVFDKNLSDIRTMLDSFTFNGKTTKNTSLHEFGNLGFTFNDIQYHSYAAEISDLADKGIITGDKNGNFNPEAFATRLEALKLILESKNALEKDKNSGKAVDFSKYRTIKAPFRDVPAKNPYAPYARYALEKKMINSNRSFGAEKPVTLAETLKLIMNAYEIPVWKGETNPWFKKYMDKGFELNLIPYGMYDAGQKLTRAELAYLINKIYKKAGNEGGFYY